MIRSLKPTLVTLLFCLISLTASAESGVESLSPELRKLLGEEMLALQEGMKSIIPAYTSGNHGKVSKIAEKMKNSYLLKQGITKAQKEELMIKMPKAFLRLDNEFHEYAGMLQHVAEEEHSELVGFYIYKLTESCLKCHTDFATHKFPNLGIKSNNGHHH